MNVMVAVMICVRLQGTRSPIFMVSLWKLQVFEDVQVVVEIKRVRKPPWT